MLIWLMNLGFAASGIDEFDYDVTEGWHIYGRSRDFLVKCRSRDLQITKRGREFTLPFRTRDIKPDSGE